MKKLWIRLKLLFYVLRVSRNPMDTAAALAIGPCLFALGHIEQTKQKISSKQKDADYIQKRYLLKKIDLHKLKLCPAGSLGRIFAEHMLTHHLDPEFYGEFEITNDESYIIMRMRQTHDLWHVLTGFSTSVQDELALQAFMFAQTGAPLSPLLIGGSLFRMSFTNDSVTRNVFSRIVEGWQLGQEAEPIFSLDWEAHWNTPLEQLRTEYRIQTR